MKGAVRLRLVVAMGVIAVGAGCAAKVPWNRGDYVALGAMVGCQAFDSATTVYGIEYNDMEEQNPMLPNDGWANVPIKLAVTAALAGIAHAMPGHAERRVALGLGAVAGCVPGAINAGRMD